MYFPPTVWGPIVWTTIHLFALGYADQPSYSEKRAAKEFYNGLQFLLPCPECREHFRDVLSSNPVEPWLDDRASLVTWTWTIHNQVNAQLKQPVVSRDEFIASYRRMSDDGVPVPPAAPFAEAVDRRNYVNGALHATGVMVAAAFVGGLLWASYSTSSVKGIPHRG